MKTDLDMAQSQLASLNTQLAITMASKDTLYSHLVDVKNSLIFVLAHIDKKFDQTVGLMNKKILVLEDKVLRVQDVIKETVQFSNRTYYMEEVRNLKSERLYAEKASGVLREKLQLVRKRTADLEGIIMEYRQRESGHIVAANFGKSMLDGEDEDVHDLHDDIPELHINLVD